MNQTTIEFQGTDTDIEAVEALVGVVEHSQRNELVEEFLALFHPEATWVTGGGKRLIGLPEIAAFTRVVLPGAMADLSVNYEPVHISFVRPDVAVVSVRQTYFSLDGAPLDHASEGRPTYILARNAEGVWQIVAAQNTGVAAE